MIKNKKAFAAAANTGNHETRGNMGTGRIVAHRHDYAERTTASPIYRCLVGTKREF